MADALNNGGAPTNTTAATSNKDAQPESPNTSPLGVYAPFPYSAEPFVDVSGDVRSALLALKAIATQADSAARRFEIEQAWEQLHFDRGYQHLLRARNGGWELPGANSGFGANKTNTPGTYDTNVYGEKGDIIVAALSREVPKQEFFAANPDYAPDIVAAEEADNFKLIWGRNNNLHALLVDCARIFWNEDRVLLWTRYELNGQKYGFEEEAETPTVPQDIMTPPGPEPTGQEGQEDILSAEESPSGPDQDALLLQQAKNTSEGGDNDAANVAASSGAGRKALGREVTTAHGKLDHKVPISVDNISEMPFVQLSFDVDVALAKATFPWIAGKIQVGGDKQADTQLDRIARENVRQAVLGAFVTGDSLARHTTITYTWLRPSMFMDDSVKDDVRAELLESFPNGCVIATAGNEFAFARNESMDDHLAIGHPSSGKGQNRRSMGASLVPIQKRINDWVDLMDDFFRRTVPKKWMNSEAFDIEALKTQSNTPGSTGAFQPQPGLTAADQYIMVEPTPQPQAALPDFIKWFITQLSEEISGALPSLFGAATGEETVGNAMIQRDQALQRVGCPWNNIQDLFAEAARQAVLCAKECRDEKPISQNIPGRGNVQVNMNNLGAGNVLCYPESNPAFPESWAQRETKLMSMIDASTQNPAIAQWLFSPANLPLLADGIRMKSFKVPGASSVAKQKGEFELLLRGSAAPNPEVLQLKKTLEEAAIGLEAQMKAQGMQEPPPEIKQQMETIVQHIKTLPQLVSTVPVAQDESELHAVEADQCFQWMNSSEGQKFKNGDEKQKQAYENVHLHWAEHVAMAKKIAAANAPPDKPPSESISAAVDKLPVNAAIQALAKIGINVTPDDFQKHQKEQLQLKVAGKAIPDALKQQ
jgi:hypothetical protein